MNVASWLIACIPILSFGFLPVVATRIGGKPTDQAMGVALGSVLFAIVVFFIRRPELDRSIFLLSMFSGLFWSVGSVGQFMGLTYLGVSRSMPISCGTQIIGASLMGVLLGEWSTATSKAYGFPALALIMIGILFTSYKEGPPDEKSQWAKGIGINIVSSIGFTGYVAILKYHHINGWDSILPQSFGQVAGILLISLLFFRVLPLNAFAARNTVSGLIWATGNIALLLSQAALGLAVAYPIGQAAIIVAVLGGVYFNRERKSRKEWRSTIAGIVIIVAGLFLIYLSGINDRP